MVMNRQNRNPLEEVKPLLTREQLNILQDQVAQTYLCDSVVGYIVELISHTRNHSQIIQGASPRATLSMASMAKAVAMLKGRDYVTPEDVQTVFVDTISHRLLLAPEAEARDISEAKLLQEILHRTLRLL